jgi:hypothetical protein
MNSMFTVKINAVSRQCSAGMLPGWHIGARLAGDVEERS